LKPFPNFGIISMHFSSYISKIILPSQRFSAAI
jgi:hypothetical protein